MTDVRPKLSSTEQPQGLATEDAERLIAAASSLKQAIDDLTQELVTGSAIGRAGARDRFEIALTEFSEITDRTRE